MYFNSLLRFTQCLFPNNRCHQYLFAKQELVINPISLFILGNSKGNALSIGTPGTRATVKVLNLINTIKTNFQGTANH